MEWFHHQDDLFSIVATTDAGGAVVERYQYGDYGDRRVLDAAGNSREYSLIGLRHGFTGQLHDDESGLVLMRHRHLNPADGKWVQRDPAWYVDGASVSGYVSSSPHRYPDPMGLMAPDELDQMLDELEACGNSPLAHTISNNLLEMKRIVERGASYVACLAKCMRDHPDRVGQALVAAGVNMVKDRAEVFGAAAGLVGDMLQVKQDGTGIEFDPGGALENAIDVLAKHDDESVKTFPRVQNSLTSTMENFLVRGASPEDVGALRTKMTQARSSIMAASHAARAARLRAAAAGVCSLSKVNAAAAAAEAGARFLKAISEECSDECCGE